jgi:hypothetical protein
MAVTGGAVGTEVVGKNGVRRIVSLRVGLWGGQHPREIVVNRIGLR